MHKIQLLLFIISVGCQSGKLPCPKVKGPRLVKSSMAKPYKPQTVTAKLESVEVAPESKSPSKVQQSKFVKNISVEEWDCPKPGQKKYMPKNIRENIRRNARTVQEQPGTVAAADSVVFN